MENDKTKSNRESQDDWLPCRSGIIFEPQKCLTERFEKRKADAFSLGLIYFSGIIVAATVFMSWKNSPNQANSYSFHRIPCVDVRNRLESYANLDISSCRLRANISKHLCNCPDCDRIYQEMIGNHAIQRPVLTECNAQDLKATVLK
jgi:hypothetical protein